MSNREAKSEILESFIRGTLKKEFNLEITQIKPAQRARALCDCCSQEQCRFYNTNVYHLSIEAGKKTKSSRTQPGVVPLPDVVTDLIIRLPSTATDLDPALQVQNEAAAMNLFRGALRAQNPQIVPELYGWASNHNGQGWLLTEFLPGHNLGPVFKGLDQTSKRSIVAQVAEILRAMQQYQLPSTAIGYGGLTFAADGAIVTCATAFPGGGPTSSHSALYTEYFRTQRARSLENEVVKGWLDTDLPPRLERASKEFDQASVYEHHLRPTLVHGDLDMHNILFDPHDCRITGLVDFELAHVGCQVEEFMYSLWALGHLMPPIVNDNNELILQRKVLLGESDPYESKFIDQNKTMIDWEAAILTKEEFAKVGVVCPSDVPCMSNVQNRFILTQALCPPIFSQEKTRTFSTATLLQMRDGEKAELQNSLQALGH